MLRLTLLTNPDMCNLHCPLCFLQQRGQKFGMGEMSFEVARAAVERFSTLCVPEGSGRSLREVIPSTMGEPLLYSHFEQLLELCGTHGVPLNLTTNGTFPGKWASREGMMRLLGACSDIKVSCMGWADSFSEMMPGLRFEDWKKNVILLLHCASEAKSCGVRTASVSLQVTLHRKNVVAATEILRWAESAGVDRIKWNLPVFLSVAPAGMRERYGLSDGEVDALRKILVSDVVRCEGSLFFGKRRHDVVAGCPFVDELWILPDGSEQHCPNPERRFGDTSAPLAQCENCPMK